MIGVSANADNETMEEGLRAGIDPDDFLPKPFSMEAFIGAINQKILNRFWGFLGFCLLTE